MNARISCILGALAATAAVASPVVAQGTFEGVITFQVSAGPGGRRTMQYSIKGDKVRMDVSAEGMEMFTLYDGATKTVDMVIPRRQMYMERSVANLQMADTSAGQTKVDWTGKKESIAGHECEHANITGADGTVTDVCLAKDLGPFVPLQGGMGGPGGRRGGMRGGMGGGGTGGSWQGHLGQAFPLKVTRNGQVEMVVTKVDEKSLDDALFTVPAGYSKMGMPGRGRRDGGSRN